MARYIGPKCKLSRREGTDLFLKSGVRPHSGGKDPLLASLTNDEIDALSAFFASLR